LKKESFKKEERPTASFWGKASHLLTGRKREKKRETPRKEFGKALALRGGPFTLDKGGGDKE